jgi:hypothetical protein
MGEKVVLLLEDHRRIESKPICWAKRVVQYEKRTRDENGTMRRKLRLCFRVNHQSCQ